MFSRIKKLFLLLLCAAPLYAAPTVTVTATSASILGTSQSISLTCVLTDPNQTGVLRSGANVITVFSTSTTTPGNTATCGPLYGNDVITDGFGNASTTYYLIGVYTVHNGIVDSAPSLLQAYQFAGSGTFDLSATLPFSLGPVSPGGSVLGQNLAFTGNNTHSGTETFTGPLNSNNLTTGNVANKPATTDGVRFVSAVGSDSNDGLSMGSAKATLSGAYSSLANCTNIAFVGGSGAVTNPCGTIYFLESVSGYTIGSTVSIAGFGVRLVGLGMHPTVLNCTVAGGCIQWTAIGPAGGVSFTADYGLSNITLNGNGTANQIGLACIDCTGITVDHVRFVNFNGTGAIGMRLLNDANFYSERTEIFDTWWDNCTIDLQISGQGGVASNSYGHQLWSGLHFTLANNNQTAFSAIGNAQLYSSSIYGVINTNLPGTNTYTSVAIGGTATIKGNFGLILDNGGAATVTTSGTTASNFSVWGFDPASNDQSIVSRDLPVIFDVTASAAINSPTWRINGVAKWNQFLDGSNSLCAFDVVNSKTTLCFLPNVGAIQALEGPAPTGFAALDTFWADSTAHRWKMSNNSNTPDTVVGANTTDTLTNKSTAAGALTGVVASGTSTLTANAALAAVTSQAAITTTATGALTTDAIEWSYASAPTAGDSLCHVSPYVTAGNVNFVRTNPTAAAQNVSALVINWRIVR